MAGGYSLVWALRLGICNIPHVPEWVFVAAFVLFDAGYLGFDLAPELLLLRAHQLSAVRAACGRGALEKVLAHADGMAPAAELGRAGRQGQ